MSDGGTPFGNDGACSSGQQADVRSFAETSSLHVPSEGSGTAASDGGEESDVPSISSEPPNWNSDDEPPEEHLGDEHVCSRDGKVKKIIRRIGKGLQCPGQYDFVSLRYRSLPFEDGSSAAGGIEHADVLQVPMGESQLPLAVEFAVKCMRIGEVAEVVGPLAYAALASPLCGRGLRTRAGRMPAMGKVSRKLRFLPAAPQDLASKGGRPVTSTVLQAEGQEKGIPPEPPTFRAEVELLQIDPVEMLTEDRSVSKQVVHAGSGRRTPRVGDLVAFSIVKDERGSKQDEPTRHVLVLGENELPYPRLEHVLLSMKQGERCTVRMGRVSKGSKGLLPAASSSTSVRVGAASEESRDLSASTIDDASGTQEIPVALVVTMHRWQKRDAIPVGLPGVKPASLGGEGELQEGRHSVGLRKFELRAGQTRLMHDIEDGSAVLVGLAPGPQPGSEGIIGSDKCTLLSWCFGEGVVPEYVEAAVATMRMAETAFFDAVPSVLAHKTTCPSYAGQTPLRSIVAPELDPLVAVLLQDRPLDAACSEEDPAPLPLPEVSMPVAWTSLGEPVTWEELGLEERAATEAGGISFWMTLLAATEAPDVCLMEDSAQQAYLDMKRAHGNTLSKLERFPEASAAYNKALDAVRRTPLYKALFPTERGRIEGAYSRDPGECEAPLEKMDVEAVQARRATLLALHLNLARCAAKEERFAEARRHASIVLGADAESAKALFWRGSCAMAAGDYEQALPDLQKAAELQPQDRIIREELQALHKRVREHREGEKAMFQAAFNPPSRKS